VPTLAEGGYPGLSAASWTGFFAPAGTPEPVLAKLNDEINAIMQEPDIARRIAAAGLDTTIRSRTETAKMFRAEIDNWSTMVKAAGVTKP
jgi:tripartite-type tricarboxylate transporter receptor subunit TctC